MKDFDAIQALWQQAATTSADGMAIKAIRHKSLDTKKKLIRPLIGGAISLLLAAVFIIWLIYFSSIQLNRMTTYIAVWIIVATILLQVTAIIYTILKIKKIDDTSAPGTHLQQWEAYYAFRIKNVRWNQPLYFIFLNLGMGLYFLEILDGRPIAYTILILMVYAAWMAYAYLVLGKKVMQKEENKLQSIINDLKEIEAQLTTAH